MKKNYIMPDMRVKAFCDKVRLDSNSELVRKAATNNGTTSINMTTVKTKDIEWK